MTKAELIEALKDFPDDMEVRIGIRKDTGCYKIAGLDQFCDVDNLNNLVPHGYITLEPGGYYEEGEIE